MANKTIQLLRNKNLYASREAALTGLQGKLNASEFDGQPILARYTVDETEHTLLGIKSAHGYEIFDNEGTSADIQAAIAALDAEVASTNGTNVKVTVTEVDGKITGVSVVDNSINATNLSNAINALDSSVSATAAVDNVYSVLTGVTQADGVLTDKTEVTLAAAAKTGAAADVSIADSGDKFTSTNVEGALAELAAKAGDISVGSLDKTVTVQAATGAAFGTDLAVNIDNATLVKNEDTGVISSDLKIVKNSSPTDTSVKEEYYLAYGSSETPIGNKIQIYKDSALLSIKLLHAYHVGQADEILPTYSNGTWTDIDSQYQTEENVALCYAYSDADGATVIAAVPVGDFLQESEFGDGLQVVSGEVSVKIDSASEDFLSVSSDGVKLDGVQDAIDTAEAAAKDYTDDEIADLDAEITSADGTNVQVKVTEADGVITAVNITTDNTVNSGDVDTAITAAIEALDATPSQTAGADGLALSLTEVDGVVTAISGSIAANTYDAYGAAAAAVAALDATPSQAAGADGLALSLTEVDGVVTAISGSIAAETYDAYGAASTAERNANVYTDGKIADLDSSVSATAASGNEYSVLTGVTQTDGKLTGKTEVTLAAAAKTGAAADVSIADSGEFFTATNVEAALAELATFDCGEY